MQSVVFLKSEKSWNYFQTPLFSDNKRKILSIMQKEYPKNLQFYFFKYSKLIFPCRNRHSAWSIALVCVKIHPIQTRPIFAYLIQNFHNHAFTQKQHKAKSQHDLCFVRNKINQSISYKRHLSCFTIFSLLDIDYMQNTTLIVFYTVVYCRFLVNFGIIHTFRVFVTASLSFHQSSFAVFGNRFATNRFVYYWCLYFEKCLKSYLRTCFWILRDFK